MTPDRFRKRKRPCSAKTCTERAAKAKLNCTNIKTMVDESKTHTENGLVQKTVQLFNTGFRITASIATGVCGESTCLCIYDSNIYPDDDSRSQRPRDYIIPLDDANDLIELAEMLKTCIKERNKTLVK